MSTPAGWVLVCACAAFGIAVAAGTAAHLSPLAAVLVPAAGAVVWLALRAAGVRHAAVALLLTAACGLGLARGMSGGQPGSAILRLTDGGSAVLSGTVRDGTGSRRSSAQVVIEVDRIVSGDLDRPVHAGVLATPRTAAAVLPGDRVELDVSGLRAPGTVGAEAVLAREGIDAVAQSPTLTVLQSGGPSPRRLLAIARGHLAQAVDAALPEPAAGLLEGIAFGIARPLPPDLTAALRDSGLAHVLAISGLKVVLVAGLVAALCRAVAASPRMRLVATALTVGGYVVLGGAGPAAVRSAVMVGAGWGLEGTGRRPDPLPLLAAVGAVMLAVDPRLSGDVGFQLSFLGTLGILLLAGPLADRLPGPRLVREPFAMALAAQVATLPVMAATFGVVSLVGPLANAVAVPLLPPLIAVAVVGGLLSAAVPAVGLVALQAAGLLALLLAAVARVAASLPMAAIHVAAWPPVLVAAEACGLLAAATAWWAVRRHRPAPLRPRTGSVVVTRTVEAGHRRPSLASSPGAPPRATRRRLPRPVAIAAAASTAALAGGAVLLLGTRPDGRLHVAVLNAGGTVVAVQAADGGHALVDTGSDAQGVLQSLGAALPPLTRTLDLLVLTASDRASAGALPALAQRYAITRVVAPAGGLAAAARSALSDLQRRGTALDLAPPDSGWTWGGAAWRLLSPDGTAATGEALSITDATGSVLLLGDLPVDAQEELAGLHGTDLGSADLLVAPASGAVAPALLDAVRPHLIAVPSATRGSRSTAAALLSGPGVRRTGDSGTLTYVGSAGGLVAA